MVVNVMDRTEEFRMALKSVRKTENFLDGKKQTSKNQSLLLRPHRNSEFMHKSKEIVKSVTKLKEFLLQHRSVYINANKVTGTSSQAMTDQERDQIDAEAQSIIKKCNETVASMHQYLHQKDSSEQVQTHRQLILSSIQRYIKSVCKVYSEQRAIRVKLVVDKKRVSRLHNPESLRKSLAQQQTNRETPDHDQQPKNERRVYIPTHYGYEESDEEITEDDAAVLEKENALLFNDMNSMVDEVRAIEGKVVEIARLQEIFSEQVLQQEGEIEMISEKVVASTENIKDGNEQVREAIKHNAGFRVWILFFLVMCSFSLLFLEWYS